MEVEGKKRQKRVEIYLLLDVMTPATLLKKFPEYSEATVYKYNVEIQKAQKKVRELLAR